MTTSVGNRSGNGIWKDVRVCGLYTLSPLHVGVGQVAGAVDLPVAREAGTGFPLIPASGLKGSARAALRGVSDKALLTKLFGPDLSGDSTEGLEVGLLTFTEARLIAYPVRSLNRPFFYATCPAILDRWQRDLRLIGGSGPWKSWAKGQAMPEGMNEHLAVADGRWRNQPLILEDLAYDEKEIEHYTWLTDAAEQLLELLPPDEDYTRRQFKENLVCLPDEDFADLMARVIPVRARTQLTDGKTTDEWIDRNDPDAKPQKGNLWYEEYIPSDTLFAALIGQRRPGDGSQPAKAGDASLEQLDEHAESLQIVQIGGNETVGYGLCSWVGWRQQQGDKE